MRLARISAGLLAAGAVVLGAIGTAGAQLAARGPPAVGVVEAIKRPMTETSEFLGRINAVNQVNVVARVTAFLEKRLFEEGNEIKAGDKLYLLEQNVSQPLRGPKHRRGSFLLNRRLDVAE